MSAPVAEAARLGVAAFVVGLSGAMSPGSYLTVTVARTMRKGPLSAGLMLVGHALLEAALLVGFAFGLEKVLRVPTVMSGLGILGGAVLLWTGSELLCRAARGTIVADLEHAEDAGLGDHPLQAVAQGAIVSLSNPYWTLWWATIGIKLAADGVAIGPAGIVAFFIGHQLADVSWYSFVIYAVHRGRGLLTPRVYRSTIAVLASFLLYIGARFALQPFGVELPWLPF